MNFFLDMFATLAGVQAIFKLGFIPKDSELYELTCEQYQHFYNTAEDANEHLDEKIYMLLPENTQEYVSFASEKEVFILTEENIASMRKAEKTIERYCAESKKEFNNLDEKLFYCASVMPGVISEGTKYERGKDRSFLSLVEETDA